MKLFASLFSKIRTRRYEVELFNERTFYKEFVKDLRHCKSEVIIESPFLTARRINALLPELRLLVCRDVRIIINTRDPREHDAYMKSEAEYALNQLHELGITILYTGGLHRKLAIIDCKILWEGSLNILSQNNSCEIMQRTESEDHVRRVINFTGLSKFLSKL